MAAASHSRFPIALSWSLGRTVAATLLTAIVVALVVRARVVTDPLSTTDLQVFWLSGKAIRTGHDPYLFWLPGARMSLVYPPFAGLLMTPGSLLSLPGLRIAWFAAVIVALQALIRLTARWAGVRMSRWWWLAGPVLALVALFVDPVWQEMWSGQVNVFLALLVIADLARPDSARGKGIGVGLAAGIKLTPGLFIVYLVLTKRYRAAWTAAATFAGTVALGFVVLPVHEAVGYWTDYAWNVQRIFSTPGVTFNQSLHGAIDRIAGHDTILPWAVAAAVVVIAGLAVCVALHRRGMDLEAVLLCGVTALLASPVSWVYHWVWLVPVLVVLVVRRWYVMAGLTALVVLVHPYTWIGGFSVVPSPLYGGERGWWHSWTSYLVMPHGFVGQLLADSLVLLGFLLLAGGAVLAWRNTGRPTASQVAHHDTSDGPQVSVVVPARDEAANLAPLAQRLHHALAGRWTYELVIVDDGSTDDTAAVVASLSRAHPVVLVRRTGTPGKGSALVDGFAHSRGGIVCMIDADLQYPPEVIPAMVSLVGLRRADVVVANRMVHGTGRTRRMVSMLSGSLLQALHGLDVDVQSGLKVIRRGVLEQVPLHPSGWAFDLELLVRARANGFRITTHDIRFTERRRGHTKVRLGTASWQILRNAIALKLAGPVSPARRTTHHGSGRASTRLNAVSVGTSRVSW